ncbi:alpha/beta hydrolase [Nocardioides sp. YIM 152588]|uniref:alpha/beta fold hydrolase n=1 Tax=Nocardioides sp. YIM 152588 TaxID=3158259 RepID=UPI0032E3DF2F
MTNEPPTSAELIAPLSHGVDLCYQTFGDPGDEPLLLIMGLGGPMTWWDVDLCHRLVERGFYVIRYDNRDTGRSTRLEAGVGPQHVARAFLTGRTAAAPYSMADLAADAAGLLDHLGIPAAHLAGVSMGGMIAQTLALAAPERVLSLTSVMSTTGRRSVGRQHPSLLPLLLTPRGGGRDAYVAASIKVWRAISSPGFPATEEHLAERAALTYERGYAPEGVLRQMMAILTQPDRTAALGTLRMPVLVLHGLADKMVHVSGGRATAAAVRGSELILINGMGHDLPPTLFESFATAIRRNADRSRADRHRA